MRNLFLIFGMALAAFLCFTGGDASLLDVSAIESTLGLGLFAFGKVEAGEAGFAIKSAEDAAQFIEAMNKVRQPQNRKRTLNLEAQKKALYDNDIVKPFREGMKRQFGFDPVMDTAKFPVQEMGFQWKKVRESLREQSWKKGRFSEADTASDFTQFLRAGIQQIVNSLYEVTDTTYEDWVTVITSDKASELYTPHHGVSFPKQIGNSEKYPEVASAALDLQLRNYKYGSIYGVEMELLDDDTTGQFQRNAGYLGEYSRLLWEVLVYGKLASVADMQYDQFIIPQTETKPSNETNYPYATSAAPFVGGGSNRPVAFGVLTQSNLQDGIIGLMNQKNLHGLKMTVRPNRLIVSPQRSFDAAILLNSSYYPSGAAAAGAVGGAFAINPVKGVADLTVSRFVFKDDGTVNGDSEAWYLCDDKKPWFLLQMREAAAVIQEASNSGASFDTDVIRYKSRSRGNADHIDPRFVWQGNDGSAT